MKSYIKLYGPSLDRGYTALSEMMRELETQYPYGEEILLKVSRIDPKIDARTGELVNGGKQLLGLFDFMVEWEEEPSINEVRALMRHIDRALIGTGCKYTITTIE